MVTHWKGRTHIQNGMKAEFSIDVDVPHDLVRITLAGFYGPDDIKRLVAARDEAFKQLQCPPNQHLTLIDVRAMDIQAQDSVATFQQLLIDPTKVSRNLAFVVAQSLARMQAKRATEKRQVSFFVTPEEAEAWLLSV
ncbi:hypothetical protein [Sphingomonas sp. LT1P40]|uniref:hypothetical protein n=1 Tax=Alteristakelama amylovorans TaxID=3096166 RepID=UPI002FCCA28A